jgi:hypothetical protein
MRGYLVVVKERCGAGVECVLGPSFPWREPINLSLCVVSCVKLMWPSSCGLAVTATVSLTRDPSKARLLNCKTTRVPDKGKIRHLALFCSQSTKILLAIVLIFFFRALTCDLVFLGRSFVLVV